jgi:hypothetical protein
LQTTANDSDADGFDRPKIRMNHLKNPEALHSQGVPEADIFSQFIFII